MQLHEVFGIRTSISSASYVDRGGLDEQFEYYLRTDRHIAIHGGSKQGKSWLRGRLLDDDDTIVVQCQAETTPETVFRQVLGALNVRAEIRLTSTNQFEGTLDFTASGELGNFLVGKVKAEGEATGTASRERGVESEAIGKTPADLYWVARTIRASEKQVVIEDFHYVTEENRRAFAFVLKALGDYGVNVIVVGVWPEDHLLTYYNGDLDGRVEDIRLAWDDEELRDVVRRGCEALNIEMTPALTAEVVRDAHGNVGLVQRLCEQICLAAGVRETRSDATTIDVGQELTAAREAVSTSMRARYLSFADDFVRGMKRMTEGLEVYKHMLRAFTRGSDQELIEGIDSRELLRRIQEDAPEATIRQSDLTQALDRVDRLQAKIGIAPLVLTYNRDRRRLFLADRSFLFYREHGNPTWPWDRDETFDTAIRAAPEGEQLDLSAMPLTSYAVEELSEEPDGGAAQHVD